MLKRLLLPALLIIGLIATAGIAIAAVDDSSPRGDVETTSEQATSSTQPNDESTTTSTIPSHDDDGDDDSTTTSTIPGHDDDGDDESTTTSTIPSHDDDDDGDDDSTTTSTIPGHDDDGDDDSTTTSTMPTAVVEDGVHVIDSTPAGTVTIEVVDGALHLRAIAIDGQWQESERIERWDKIKLEFKDGGSELEIEAKIEDGTLRFKVTFEDD